MGVDLRRIDPRAAVTVSRFDPGQGAQASTSAFEMPGACAPDAVQLRRERAFHLPKRWLLMRMTIACGVALMALLSLSAPPLLSIACYIAALAILHTTNNGIAWERADHAPTAVRTAILTVWIGLPMFLLGTAAALWVQYGALSWEVAISALVCMTSTGAAILTRRMPAQFAAQIACWCGVAAVNVSPASFLILAVGVGIASVVCHNNARIELTVAQAVDERERVRNRSRDLLTAFEAAGLGWFWETDRHGNLVYLTDTVATAIRQSSDDLIGRPFIELFDMSEDSREGERTLAFHISTRSGFNELLVKANSDTETRWWSISGKPVHDNFGNYVGFRGAGQDLTEKRRSQEQATRLAHYDSLTGLANRFQMAQLLDKILAAQHESQRDCSVFLLDLDRFKQVNDTLGHPAGDALLRQVAQRLERVVDAAGRVGRLGGDEFQVILPGRLQRDVLANLAGQIIEALSQPYSIDGNRVTIGVSIGIALAPDNGQSSESLIRNADLSLYAAKDAGRGRFHFYSSDLHHEANERRQLEQDLRDAISQGGLELHYQPVVATATERIVGFEALLRWDHPVRGQMSPAKFIDIAEEAGLISIMGEWALRQACDDMSRWPDEVRVAVNVSPLQFANPQLPAIVTSALAQSGIDASRLELEITESVFLNDDADTDTMFKALKGIGVRLALDDFGTGYSSLGYLKKAPFDKIKIDQSFVRGATQPGSRNGAIIASITSLAQALGMDTTAEGVETLDELNLVRMHGCSHIQGYIYEKPLNAADATERLASGLSAIAEGPRSARAPRQTMLRKIVLEHGGQFYNATVKNLSDTGALIEGLWNVPPGTIFSAALTETLIVSATARWSAENRVGLEFAERLQRDNMGALVSNIAATDRAQPPPRRKAS